MKVTFGDVRLEKAAGDERYCRKLFGRVRAEKYLRRLNDLFSAECLEDVRNLPGHYHELTGDRKGQWACDLNQPYRLIIRPLEKPIPMDLNRSYIWTEIFGVEILEIVDYHK